MKKIIIGVFALATMVSCKNEKKKDKTATPVEKTAPAEVKKEVYNGPNSETVINNYFKAIGGLDKVKAVKTLVTKAETNVGGQTMTVLSKFAEPNKFSTTFTDKDGNAQRQFFDGEKAFMQADNQKIQMSPIETDIFKQETTPFADVAYLKGKVKGIEDVDGEKAYVIETKDKQVFYSVKTGLKIKDILSFEDSESGQKLNLPTYYSDYKEVAGIKFPHTVVQDMGEGESMKMTFKSFEVNKNVSDKDFK